MESIASPQWEWNQLTPQQENACGVPFCCLSCIRVELRLLTTAVQNSVCTSSCHHATACMRKFSYECACCTVLVQLPYGAWPTQSQRSNEIIRATIRRLDVQHVCNTYSDYTHVSLQRAQLATTLMDSQMNSTKKHVNDLENSEWVSFLYPHNGAISLPVLLILEPAIIREDDADAGVNM